MEQLRVILGNLWRYGWMIPVVAVVAAATAAAVDAFQTPIYRVAARVAVRPMPIVTDTRTLVNEVGVLNDRTVAGTFARMFTAPAQKTAAQQAAGLTPSAAAQYQLAAGLLPDAPVIEVSVTGRDPGAARNYLNAAVQVTTANTRDLFGAVDLLPLEPAQPPTRVTPRPERDALLAAALGLLGGFLLTVALPYLREPPQAPAPRRAARPAADATLSEPS